MNYKPGDLLRETYALRWVWRLLATFAFLAMNL